VAPLRRPITAALGDFSLESLGGTEKQDGEGLERRLELAIRYYLADRDGGRAGWPYPDFGRDGQEGGDAEVRVNVDGAVWAELSQEAERQGVSTDQLLQHAVLYFAADRDAGRVTQRIVDDLDGAES
jgi:hypothetical protein